MKNCYIYIKKLSFPFVVRNSDSGERWWFNLYLSAIQMHTQFWCVLLAHIVRYYDGACMNKDNSILQFVFIVHQQ